MGGTVSGTEIIGHRISAIRQIDFEGGVIRIPDEISGLYPYLFVALMLLVERTCNPAKLIADTVCVLTNGMMLFRCFSSCRLETEVDS